MAPRGAFGSSRAGLRRPAAAFLLLPAVLFVLGGRRQTSLVPPLDNLSGPAPRLPLGGGSAGQLPSRRQRALSRIGCAALDASNAIEGADSLEAGSLDAVEEESATEAQPPQEQWNLAGWVLRGFAGVGVLDTAYLTAVKLGQVPLLCPAESSRGCTEVLSSPWASVGPVPLAALGLAAYVAVAALSFAGDWTQQRLLWWLCLLLATVSLGLEAVILLDLHAPCVFCALSAFSSAMLLAIVDAGQQRRESRSPRREVLGLASLVALGALRVATLPPGQNRSSFYELAQSYNPEHPPVRSKSSEAEKALARHLTAVGAACYTAWWCPHCQDQREQFGSEAVLLAPFVQCSTEKRKQKPECKDKGIDGYPTWIIDGKKYGGGQDLARLARITGFEDFPEDAFQPRDDEVTEYIWGKQEDDDP